MPRTFECSKCGADISDSYQSAEPDVGIGAGWYCDACDLVFGDEDGPEIHDDDVPLFGTGDKTTSNRCPNCLSTELEMGYGLAGGGIGPYSYCSKCGTIIHKSQDLT